MHTIVGMTIDIAAGNCLDRFAKIITEYLVDLQTKGQLEEQMLHFAQSENVPIESLNKIFSEKTGFLMGGNLIDKMA